MSRPRDMLYITEIVPGKKYRVEVPSAMVNGKRGRRYVVRVDGNYTKARQERDRLRKQRDEDDARRTAARSASLDGDVTVAQYVDRFLADKERQGISEASVYEYRHRLKTYLVPAIGDLKLREVTPTHVRDFFSDLVNGGKDGRALATSTREGIERYTKSLFKRATLDRIIDWDPTLEVEKTKVREKEPDPITEEEAAAFLKHLEGGTMHLPAVMLYATGMRPEELRGLRWSDIETVPAGLDWDADDFAPEGGTVHITQAAHDRRGKGGTAYLGELKSRRSKRSLQLGADIMQLLKVQREAISEARAKVGAAQWEDHDLVFPSLRVTVGSKTCAVHLAGRVQTYPAFSHRWAKARGPRFAHVRPYTLRHTYCTHRLVEGHQLEAVSRWMGHANSTVTAERYAHVLPKQRLGVPVAIPTVG